MISNVLVSALRALLRAYQLVLSPLLGANCRFAPSCSEYAREALLQHGPARGSVLAAQRLARCHPWHEGGFDPVPPQGPRASSAAEDARSHA